MLCGCESLQGTGCIHTASDFNNNFLIIDGYTEAQRRERQRTVRVYVLDLVSDHAVLGTRYDGPVTASCAYQMPNVCANVLASRKRCC